MRVAAYQAPLDRLTAPDVLELVRAQILRCETEEVSILCCPEALLGGLADNHNNPAQFAIPAGAGPLEAALAPLASATVTTIMGFTEFAAEGKLYNAAAVVHRGTVIGIYRKVHPAIHRSVYDAGSETPVFKVGALTFGIVICNDSNFSELPKHMAAQGASALFIPTNNALPSSKGGAELVTRTRNVDQAIAIETGMWVIRADIAGRAGNLISHGTTGIVRADGEIIQSSRSLTEDLIMAEVTPRCGG
jgi:predicted amidohydrolase